MTNRRLLFFGLLLLIITGGVSLTFAEPSWIQYDERVVGENSPTYDDVVNRPAKFIWEKFLIAHNDDGTLKSTIPDSADDIGAVSDSIFLSEHNADGSHKLDQIDHNQLLNYDSDEHIDWTDTSEDFKTTGTADLSGATVKLKVYIETSEPDIPTDSLAIWTDEYTTHIYLIIDIDDTQKKIELS